MQRTQKKTDLMLKIINQNLLPDIEQMPTLKNTIRSSIVALMDQYLEVFDISEDFLGLVMNAMIILKIDMTRYCKKLESCYL